MPKQEIKNVYAVVEVSGPKGPHSCWVRIGHAFVNRDGSLNVRLDAVPMNGSMQIRDAEPPS